MCIGFWSLEHPDYALILCTNRDEYLSRPTSNAHFHAFESASENLEPSSNPPVLSGRDLQAGGTWFGINRSGRVALLTNITEPTATYKSSRGHLASTFLATATLSPTQYIQDLTDLAHPSYAGFNLVLFSPSFDKNLSYNADLITNSGGGGTIVSRPLKAPERRIGGLSNGIDGLGGNEWPKVLRGQVSLEQILGESSSLTEAEITSRLLELLTWQSAEPPSNRAQLRNTIQIQPLRMTQSLSPDSHAEGPDFYGTRLSTVLLIRKDGRVLFIERDIWQLDSSGEVTLGDPRNDRVFRFTLAADDQSEG